MAEVTLQDLQNPDWSTVAPVDPNDPNRAPVPAAATAPAPDTAPAPAPAPEVPQPPLPPVAPTVPTPPTPPPSTTGEGLRSPFGVVVPTQATDTPVPGITTSAQAMVSALRGGPGQAFPAPRIISGFRSPERNAAVGGARDSEHTRGNALDFDVSGWTDEQKRAFIDAAIANGARGVGIYPSGRSIHLDVRGTPAIWGMGQMGPYRRMELNEAPAWARSSLAKLLDLPEAQAPGSPNWRPRFGPGTIQQRVTDEAIRMGMNPATVLAIIAQESGFNPNARPIDRRTGQPLSSAFGLFQMTAQTRAEFGVPDNADEATQIAGGMRMMKAKYDAAKAALGRDPTAAELYVMHYQGIGAGPRILSNPNGSFRDTLNTVRPGYADQVLGANPWLNSINTNADFVRWSEQKVNHQLGRLGQTRSVPMNTDGTGRNSIPMSSLRTPQPISFEFEEARRTAEEAQRWGSARLMQEMASREWSTGYFDVWRQDRRFASDPDWFKNMTPERTRELTRDIPEDHWDYIMRARSAEHAAFLRDRVKEEVEYERQLASRGLGTQIGRMGMAVVDPVGWALVVATGPLVGGASRLSRLQRAGILGTEGAATSMLLQLPQTMYRPGSDYDDLLMAGAFGAAFGGVFGAAMKPRIDPDLARQTSEAAENLLRSRFGENGSLGAAASPTTPPLRTDSYDVMNAEVNAEINRPGMGWLRRLGAAIGFEDFASALSRSDNELVAWAGNKLLPDPVGYANRDKAVGFASSEIGAKIFQAEDHMFSEAYVNNFSKWAESRGISVLKGEWTGQGQDEFNELVTRAVRNTNALYGPRDPHVLAQAEAFRKMTDRFAQLAADPGILIGKPGTIKPLRGWENIASDPNYAPRFTHWAKMNESITKHSYAAVRREVSTAIRKAQPSIEKELSDKLAETWLTKHREVKAGMNSRVGDGLSGRDTYALRELLYEEGYEAGTIERLVNLLSRPKDGDAGAHARAKFRLLMDETHEVDLPTGTFRIDDMFDNDIVRLGRMYNRQMSGQIAMSHFQVRNPRWSADAAGDVPEFLVEGISSRADWDNYINKVKGVYDEKGTAGHIRERELAQLQRVYDLITGNPHKLETGQTGFIIRTLQKINFARVMNQVGFAQVAEFGNILGQAGTKAFMEAMPMYNRLVMDAATGNMDPKLARELVYMTSAGTDWVRSFANGVDEYGSQTTITGSSKLARGIEDTLDRAGRVTSAISGMAPVNYVLQRMAAGAAVAKFANMAGDAASIQVARLRVMGLDEKMTGRVLEEIKTKAGRVRLGEDISGANINALNLEKWDPEVRANFENAIWRWSRHMVQQNDIGQMSMATSHPVIGKLLFQFRSFMFGAYTKQTLHNIHMRDWASFNSFAFSMAFGGVAYAAQTYLQSIGRSNQEEFLREKLGDDDKGTMVQKLSAAAFARTGHSSLFPFMFDQGAGIMGLDPLFGGRASGLPTQGLISNPTFGLADSLFNTLKNTVGNGGDFSQVDARRAASLLLFQNFMPFQWTFNSFIQGLPETD
jgi:hypothetical protein